MRICFYEEDVILQKIHCNKSCQVKYFLKALVTQFHVPLTKMCCNAKLCVAMKR